MSDHRNSLAGSFSWNTLTVVLQVVIQLAYTGLLARLVSKDSFMLMGIVLSIMGFAEIFSQVGVGPALIQRKEVHQQHLNGAFYTAVILGVSFTLLFVLLAQPIATFYHLQELRDITMVVASSFTISAIAVVPRSMMMKHMRFKTMFKASMISIVGGNVIVGLTLAWMGWNVWAYVWALFTQNALMTLALWYYEPVKLTVRWEWKYTRELIRYGAGSTLFNALNYLATKMDVMLVPRFLRGGAPELDLTQKTLASYYERSSYAMTQPITVMGKLSDSVLFSGMSRMQDETAKLRKTILVATNMLSILIVPFSIFVAFFAEDIIGIWLGEDYTDAGAILKILFFAVIFRTLSKLGDSLLRARDAVFQGSWFKAIYVILIALGIWIAVPYGMTWVAAAIVFATVVHYLMNMHMCTQLIGIHWSALFSALIPSLKLGFIALVLSGLIWYVRIDLHLPHMVGLGAGMTLVFGIIASVVYLRPDTLGKKDINPISFLPDKLKKISVLATMVKRLEAVA
ncbi:MAG: lipopolysaccharide biosynthesis protein [Flavobacteriales bacterium]|nr:lipopolysaccharide biosynthesis protein [Flavobacteriales bacterium]